MESQFDKKIVFHFNVCLYLTIYFKMEILIYTLSDPDTNEVRYLGITSRTLKKRLGEHLNNKNKTHNGNWIQKLLKSGKTPVITLLTTTTKKLWEEDEKFWIIQLRAWGFNLTNTAEGGKGGLIAHTEETKLKMSKTRKGRKYDWGPNISAALKGTRLGTKRGSYKLSEAMKTRGDARLIIPRPNWEQLNQDLEELKRYSAIAKKYQVNRSVVNNWFKFYERYGTNK